MKYLVLLLLAAVEFPKLESRDQSKNQTDQSDLPKTNIESEAAMMFVKALLSTQNATFALNGTYNDTNTSEGLTVDELFSAKDDSPGNYKPVKAESQTGNEHTLKNVVTIVLRPTNTFPSSNPVSASRSEKRRPVSAVNNVRMKDLRKDIGKLCGDGTPLIMSGNTVYCSSKRPCPGNYWCHVGTSKDTTYCCPRSPDDICDTPMMAGEGGSKINRWYYDTNSNLCKNFTYTGIGGNQNNFLTESSCRATCGEPGKGKEPEIINAKGVRRQGGYRTQTIPPLYPSGPVQPVQPVQPVYPVVPVQPIYPFVPAYTKPVIPVTAPVYTRAPTQPTPRSSGGYGYQSSIGTNPCVVSMSKGTGTGSEPRWYYDAASQQCRTFTFLGSGGNANNFRSRDECQNTCGAPLYIDSSVCSYGQDVGNGPYSIPRWSWNTMIQACNLFYYRGYGGNYNRFPTQKMCEESCRPVIASTIPYTPAPYYPTPAPYQPATYATPMQPYQPATPAPYQPATPAPYQPPTPAPYQPATPPPYQPATPAPYQPATPAPYQPTPAPYQPATPPPYQPATPPPFQPTPAPYQPATPAPYQPTPAPYQPATPPPYQPATSPPYQPATPPPYQPAADPCTLPLDPGTGGGGYGGGGGSAGMQRYYFDPIEKICKPFTYRGTGGNANNFATLEDCRRRCNEQTSPCRVGTPAYIQYCGANSNYQCSAGTYCHYGAGSATTVCCPKISDNPCTQGRESGSGYANLDRYYFDQLTGRCQSFVYLGLQGNQNNFLTYDQCTQTCGLNPCGYGTPYSKNGQNIQCAALQKGICPKNYYCHVGADTYTTVCCPISGEDPCNLPILPGRGPGQLQRWAYNAQSKKCQSFVYTGIGGNENNYQSEADCQGSCRVATNPCAIDKPLYAAGSSTSLLYCTVGALNVCPSGSYCHIGAGAQTTVCCPVSGANRCMLPLATGTGNAVLTRYYFDYGASMCKAFTYTGIKGNENNFLSLVECRRACPEYDNPCPTGEPPVNLATGQVRFCSQTNPTCPQQYWCHMGANRQTTVCCPNPSNPCTLTRSLGLGQAQLPRWFYDAGNRVCLEFIYTGKKGNQNNFQTKADCEAACPVLDNPCGTGMPAMTAQDNPLLCSTVNPDICPPTYWCHIGSNAASTLCCPGAGDPCRMPLTKGTGVSVLNRWYYNTDTQTCLSFTYSGKGGNQNNFLSLAECRLRCPEFQNPCSTGQPHIGLNGQITHCGATTPSICPTTYWCHVGATLDTSVCCPGAGNPCELPLAQGNGNAALHRYYYEPSRQTCTAFQYTGMGGNQNNFMTQVQCEQRCPVFRNPCGSGSPARNAVGQIIPCSVGNLVGCPNQYWCHVGADEKTTLCCPAMGVQVCRQPLAIGTGPAALPRHYYNSLTQQCLPFTYSGIGGNENNFLSRADCERSCQVFLNPCSSGDPSTGPNGQYTLCTATNRNVCPANYWCHIGDLNQNSVCCPGAENPCILPPATGNGNEALSRFYFDTNSRKCSQYTYTGLGGNQNNFLSIQDCQLTCPEFKNPCSIGDPAQSPGGGILFCSRSALNCPATYWCHVGADDESTVCCPGASAPCMHSLLPGTGTARLSRWYFNQNTRQCLEFTYTGIGGNQNNFLSEMNCVRTCPVFHNPCGSTLNPPQAVFCSAQTQGSCPAGYWCHVGITSQTSVCCPGSSDPCNLQLSEGTGTTSVRVTRWYFDRYTKACKQFQYSGIGGNQNNFLTQTDCQHKCPEFSNPCIGGEPYQEQLTGLVKYCNRNVPTDCPAQFWCHVGASQQTTVCCPGYGDRCTLKVAPGNGLAALPRWYFNMATRQCQQFTYRGMGGNQNNFLTQRDCQLKCPEFNNPCGNGNPLTTVSGQIQYCSRQNPNICPPTYFCHIGIAQDTTVCCPGAGDPCNLPRQVGRGSAAIQRYYFNQVARQCQSFSYTGIGGNANNFLTLTDCRRKCAEFENPCGTGMPYRSPGGQVLYCNSGSVCPSNYFCHYGKDSTQTMCCPSYGDPCILPVIIGGGTYQLTRYYYSSVLRSCVSFVYSGLGGNENNFRTQSECQGRCQPLANPCGGTLQPYRDTGGKNVQCGSSTGQLNQMCPVGFFCHVGIDVWNTVCCPTYGNRCRLQMLEGIGSANLQRWYLNPSTNRCQLFSYRGSAGNANNFLTEEECQKICSTNLLQDGPCPQGEPLVDANGQKKTCEVNYPQPEPQGCPTSYVCNLQTTTAAITGSYGYSYGASAPASQTAYCCPDPRYFCIQPRDPGGASCPGSSVTRFGYSPQTDTCVPFRYSGCGGNLNNFYTLEFCTRVCCNKGFNRVFLLASSRLRFHDGTDEDDMIESESIHNLTSLLASNSSIVDVMDILSTYGNLTNNQIELAINATSTGLGSSNISWTSLLPHWLRRWLN